MAIDDVETQKDHDSSELSRNSEVVDGEKKEEDVNDLEKIDPLNEPESEYVHGGRLAFLMVSLMLCTFLIALDNVSDRTSTKTM